MKKTIKPKKHTTVSKTPDWFVMTEDGLILGTAVSRKLAEEIVKQDIRGNL